MKTLENGLIDISEYLIKDEDWGKDVVEIKMQISSIASAFNIVRNLIAPSADPELMSHFEKNRDEIIGYMEDKVIF